MILDLQKRVIELEADASWMPKESNPRGYKRAFEKRKILMEESERRLKMS